MATLKTFSVTRWVVTKTEEVVHVQAEDADQAALNASCGEGKVVDIGEHYTDWDVPGFDEELNELDAAPELLGIKEV